MGMTMTRGHEPAAATSREKASAMATLMSIPAVSSPA